MHDIRFPDKPILLDGGMGRELRSRGVDVMTAIWSASALISAPDTVRQIHQDYIAAGADIITTNTYGIIRSNLAVEGLEDQFEELNVLACTLARQARQESETSVLIAGSLPPLAGSYRPDLVGEVEDILPLYMEQAELLAPYVDLILCETMSSAAEGRAAALAACQTGKPVWVAWTLHEDRSGNLRSDETISLAAEFLSDLPVTGFLVNCCAPESITKALPQLIATGADYVGGYANTFQPIPEDWRLEGDKQTDGSLDLRSDLDPASYAAHGGRWLQNGANVVGGCCGTGPAHIAKIYELFFSPR
jgi:S-methylmethionine-dependent homocysteine/selenocysteine methylase